MFHDFILHLEVLFEDGVHSLTVKGKRSMSLQKTDSDYELHKTFKTYAFTQRSVCFPVKIAGFCTHRVLVATDDSPVRNITINNALQIGVKGISSVHDFAKHAGGIFKDTDSGRDLESDKASYLSP